LRNRISIRILSSVLLLLFLSFLGCDAIFQSKQDKKKVVAHRDDAQKILKAYQRQQSNLFVESFGEVSRILPDDLKGSRHQRFILRLNHGQTLLISHNIDIAKRIDSIRIGDRVYFRGEYEWNSKGGVVHWTHHDPNYRRVGGWLEHKGIKYE